MATLNPYHKKIAQSVIAFVLGSQAVHFYLDPLEGIDKLVEEKKSKLWQEYLEQHAAQRRSN